MTRPHRVFARERETVSEALPGDVVGVTNPGLFAIGDTLCAGDPLQYDAIPRFPPERFAILRNTNVSRFKQFAKGLEQLEAEGVVQVLYDTGSLRREPILAVVGDLQFDVVQARMASEYGVETTLERLPFDCARWVTDPPDALERIYLPTRVRSTRDRNGALVVLFPSEWDLAYCVRENPAITFAERG